LSSLQTNEPSAPFATSEVTSEAAYLAIHLDCIRVDSILDFDLYLKVNGSYVLYRAADLPFTDQTRRNLLENRVQRLYIADSNRSRYQRYIEDNLDKVLSDPSVTEEKKATILYDTSTELVKVVLANPTYGDNIQRSKDLVTNTIGYILEGREAFHSLMKITSFDYYTYTHSVNVCTFSVALAQQLGLTDKRFLHDLGVGALLHDVGKSRISNNILMKRGSLTDQEFEIMKHHPQWGVEILRDTDELTATSYYPVLEHHERGDGGGYPNNLLMGEIHDTARIVAIADSFDAMTTDRVYQKAMDTFPVLRLLFSLKGAYDEEYLRAFAELMGPTGLT